MIRAALPGDVPAIAQIADERRREYAEVQPQFWRPAAEALAVHTEFLHRLVSDDDVVALVDGDASVRGYVFATMVPAPPVYDPGGPTGSIDDFSVSVPELWPTVGVALLRAAMDRLATRGAAQVVVVSGQQDAAKQEALTAAGLTVASQWWTAPLGGRW